jgi:ribonucleotide monophosphatase NagD (HAD superfamily)
MVLLFSGDANQSVSRMALRRFAVAFDIDGVLLRGSRVIPSAASALAKLRAARVPHILMTNGGGYVESVKARSVSKLLELPDGAIEPRHVCVCHTPMRALAARYSGQLVMLSGKV